MVVEHPSGILFVAGYGRPHPTLWKSADAGKSWARVDVGTEADGAIGNSDVDLAVAPDGTLYFANMLYDRKSYEGLQITIGTSRDVGATWSWTTLSKTRFDDRPWVEVAPDGTAHVIWNDGGGVAHAISRDRGATWTERPRVHPQGCSSHLAIGPAGEIAVRITPLSASGNRFDAGGDLIAISRDGGGTWQTRSAPGTRDWSAEFESPDVTPRWVEPLAWDSAGRLYSLWTDRSGVHLARSDDHAETWKQWLIVPSRVQVFFPYLIALRRGELAATWFTRTDAKHSDLRWHYAVISDDGSSRTPLAIVSPGHDLESWRPREGEGMQNDPGGEYLALAALRNGRVAIVTPIQNQPKQRNGFVFWEFE